MNTLAALKGSQRPGMFIGLLILIFATTGCASRTVDGSFHDLSAALDRLTRTISPPDAPRDCGASPPNSLTLNVRFNGACPKEIVPAENGCVDRKSKNVACVCRNNVGNAELNWRSVDGDGNPVSGDYQLFFDPFKSGPGLSANGQGEIKNKKLIDSPPVTSQGETIVFKYTVYKPGCDPVDPRIIIGE